MKAGQEAARTSMEQRLHLVYRWDNVNSCGSAAAV